MKRCPYDDFLPLPCSSCKADCPFHEKFDPFKFKEEKVLPSNKIIITIEYETN